MRKFLIIYLVAILAFGWGFSAMRYGIFPAGLLAGLKSGMDGPGQLVPTQPTGPSENQSKEQSYQAGHVPENLFVALHVPTLRDYHQLDVPGLNARRKPPLAFTDAGATNGFRLIFGAFDFQEGLLGAILLDPGQRVIRRWNFSSVFADILTPEGSEQGLSRSIGVLENGSVVVGDDNRGSGIFRFGLCDDLEWFSPGTFNDVVHMADNGNVIWALENDSLVSLDAQTGERLKTITLNDVHLANPDIAVFTPRRSLRVSKWYHDPVHTGDVEPLDVGMAERFPGFDAGDLLVSYRSLNLVLVLDPQSLEIKWWRTGIGRRQTDVDWNDDGWISMFNNNRRDNRENWDGNLPDQGERYSGVVRTSPETGVFETVFDGSEENLYSAEYGKHQFIPGGNLLVVSPEQGRVVEVSGDGSVVFDFINRSGPDRALRIADAVWLPADFFSKEVIAPGQCPGD